MRLPPPLSTHPTEKSGARGLPRPDMQMDPAVRTIAISGATAIIGYISSSLLNMRADRPMWHKAAALEAAPQHHSATASREPTLTPTPHTSHPTSRPEAQRACTLHVHCTCTARALHVRCTCAACALHVHRMCTACACALQAQQHLGRVERVNEQLKELYGPLLACVTASKSAYDAMVQQVGAATRLGLGLGLGSGSGSGLGLARPLGHTA